MEKKSAKIDVTLTATYGAVRLEKAQKATRLLCLMAVFAFTSFALVDLYVAEGSIRSLYTVRASFIAFGLGMYWLSGRATMKAHSYKTGAAICIGTGMGVVILTEMTGGSTSVYWTMIMLTFFTASLIMPFRPLQAAGVFIAIALFYDVWLLINDAVPDTRSWVISNAGIWLSVFISILAVVFIDDLRDREDADRYELEGLNVQLREEIAEREKAESELLRTQQLDAVGRLAAGMAHELNNLLLVISGSAELIQRETQTSDKYTNRILESAHRGARLTSDMLLFAREGHRQNQPFPLNAVVKNISDVVAETQKMVTRIETKLSPFDPWISGDRQLISQVLLNLCLNGVDALKAPGTIEINTVVEGDLVVLTVKDSGKGMTAEEMERAFEPFFTTKAPGKGTGLGLSMVYGTIKDHHGTIRLDSQPDQGTSVTIQFPTVSPAIERVTDGNAPKSPLVSKSRILLVDDDRSVREMMVDTLKEYGHELVEATDGLQACQLFEEPNAQFDLVILDLVMPRLNGIEAYTRIRKRCADQRVLLYSGNTNDDALAHAIKNPHTRFVQKPFRQADLLVVVKQLLTEPIP